MTRSGVDALARALNAHGSVTDVVLNACSICRTLPSQTGTLFHSARLSLCLPHAIEDSRVLS